MKQVMIGCLVAGVVGVIACAILFWVVVVRELPTADVALSLPPQVETDASLELKLTVSNPHDETIILDSIDIDDSFLEGFQVLGITPETTDTVHIFGQRSWSFGLDMEPGDSMDVVFNLRAVAEGHFSGDIDVCNDNQDFRTVVADVVVRNPQ